MADIILTKADGSTDVTYKPQSNQGTVKVYANESAGLVEPETLRVQHILRPIGAKGTDRHNVTLQKLVVDDTTNQNLVMSVSLQYSIPRSSEITLAMLKDMQAQLTSYVNRTANLTSLFNGATPEGDYNVTGPFNPTLA
jgi:hypothetical protein